MTLGAGIEVPAEALVTEWTSIVLRSSMGVLHHAGAVEEHLEIFLGMDEVLVELDRLLVHELPTDDVRLCIMKVVCHNVSVSRWFGRLEG